MRRLLILFAFAVLLAVLVVLNRAAADWRPVVGGAPGELVYAASFDGAPDDPFNLEWEQYGGRLNAGIADGALQIEVGDAPSLPYSLSRAHYADFDLRARASAVSGPIDNSYGVIFRAQDAANNMRFMVSSDGYYQVARILDGVETILSAWILDETNVRAGLNAVNHLRVIGVGDRFAFEINGASVPLCVPNEPGAISTYAGGQCYGGTMQTTLSDGALSTGRVGVIAGATGTGGAGVIARFVDVIVIEPDAALTP